MKNEISFEITLIFLISVCAFFSIYDLGYIENDVKTVLKEHNPTIRINSKAFEYYQENYLWVILVKTSISLFLLLVIHLLSKLYVIETNILHFSICIFITRIVFYFHNKIRSVWNVLTFSLLSLCKYVSLLVLFAPASELIYYIALAILMFPVVRALEHATKPKYGLIYIQKIVGSADLFRVKYYFLILIFSLLLPSLIHKFDYFYSSIFLYYLIYRLIICLLVKYKSEKINTIRMHRSIKK
ncbi:hypothetical protein [Pseudoalteromonas sp. Z9A6]|uniref:hypothetical protein n=1 Tax=Pseudoalteromonas sp. Z9A6 TaxID=2686352 RepID=UPI0013FD43B8|nr:hypothetical protein [Pseudoalteromonas sp. Z9A6]